MEPQQPLVCPSHTKQYVYAAGAGFLVGALIVFLLMMGNYQKGFNAAKSLVTASPVGSVFKVQEDVRTYSGSVTTVNSDNITIHIQQTNPFDDPALLDRTVKFTADTKITKSVPGDIKKFQEEMDAFMKKMQSGNTAGAVPPTPPVPTVTTINASDIAVGNTVTVTATENISTMKTFTASEIQVQ